MQIRRSQEPGLKREQEKREGKRGRWKGRERENLWISREWVLNIEQLILGLDKGIPPEGYG